MEPTQPINMGPDQLRRQAELIAASQTPSGIIRQPLSDEQLLQFSKQAIGQQENIAAIEAQKEAQKLADIEAKNKTQSELAALGLKPPVAQTMPVSMPSTQVSDADVVSRGGVAVPSEMQATQMVTQPVAPTGSYQNLIKSGISAQDAASQKSLDATDQIMKQYELNQARLQQSRFDAENELKSKIGEIDQKQKDFTWDNRSLWEKSSTGQKVMLAITGFLSSLSSQGAKTFQDTVSNTMARDLAQQKERYALLKEQKKEYQSLYGDLVKRFGDEDMASLQLTNMQLNAVSNRLKILSDNAQSKIVAAKALQGIDLVNSEIAKNQATMVNLATAKRSDVIPGYEGSISNDSARNRFIESKDASDVALSSINELKKLGKEAKIPLTKESSSYVILREKLSNEIAKANAGGKPSDLDVENAKKMIPSVYSPNFETSLDSLAKRIRSDIKLKAKNLGLKPAGEEIGRLK